MSEPEAAPVLPPMRKRHRWVKDSALREHCHWCPTVRYGTPFGRRVRRAYLVHMVAEGGERVTEYYALRPPCAAVRAALAGKRRAGPLGRAARRGRGRKRRGGRA